MPGQWYSWTCSACATEFVERASGAARGSDIYANREAVGYHIGYPDEINSQYGLMNTEGPGAALQRVLREHAGLETQQGWLSFDEAYDLYSHTFGLGSGQSYYHWVGFRGAANGRIYIANSAPGYCGIWNELTPDDWHRLGSWNCLWVPQ
jgi:hypothetical protein